MKSRPMPEPDTVPLPPASPEPENLPGSHDLNTEPAASVSPPPEDSGAFDSTHAASLALPGLNLEVFYDPALPVNHPHWNARMQQLTQRIQALWPQFMQVAKSEGVFDTLGVNFERHTLEIELTWIGNPLMHSLNREYRQKDSPTDVLTFTLLADASDPALWLSLPVLQLGSIFISIDWADTACRENPTQPVEAYLLERFVHGLLHLHGFHHDTMPQYHRVVAIQQHVLKATFGEARD